jgi:DNA modification methylase
VYDKFENICELNINRINTLRNVFDNEVKSEVISNDARNLTSTIGSETKLEDESVDLILTSPPYAGAQKYIRASWLNLFWLGKKHSQEIQQLNKENIGREIYSKREITRVKTGIQAADDVLELLYKEGKEERAFIVGNYLNEMKIALDESIRVLKSGGYMVLVIGNNTVCGRPFDTQDYLTSYILSKGVKLQFKLIDDIKSYGLMTKRNKTASCISCEWVLVFKK